MALQSTADHHLRNGLLPVSSVSWPLFPVFNFAFITICFHTVPQSVFWKWNVHILTHMHHSLTTENFCDQHENATEPDIMQNHNKHMGYVDIRERMVNSDSYNTRHRSGKKNIFPYLRHGSYIIASFSWVHSGSKWLTQTSFFCLELKWKGRESTLSIINL